MPHVPTIRELWRNPVNIVRPAHHAIPLPALVCAMAICSFGYGAAMGTYGGLAGDRVWQVLYSGLKLPLLLSVTFLMGLPAYFVLNTLLGVRADFPEALRALVRSQAALAVVLVSLAPYTLLWYRTSGVYPAATLFNGLMLAVASGASQILLRRSYRPLVARAAVHRKLLRIWLALYIFVGIQMAWVLRPFLGAEDLAVRFFREDSWGNAYVVVGKIVWGLWSK